MENRSGSLIRPNIKEIPVLVHFLVFLSLSFSPLPAALFYFLLFSPPFLFSLSLAVALSNRPIDISGKPLERSKVYCDSLTEKKKRKINRIVTDDRTMGFRCSRKLQSALFEKYRVTRPHYRG